MQRAMPPCIVLAGGAGTRLKSAVADRPKLVTKASNSTL